MRGGKGIGVIGALLLVSSVACGGKSQVDAGASNPGDERALDASDFDQNRFGDSAVVDNRWFPLEPGTQWTWEGHALDGKERIDRRVVFTITDLTKEVDGVRVVVAWDLDYNDDVLEEAELAFFAQDVDGNVWHLGQYPEEYENGEIVKTPTWIAGVEGAKPGIAMKAHPELGTPSYAQGWGPQVGWNDRAITYRMGERTCVPVRCYEDVLVTREFSRTEPGAYQLKYYAPGVGNVRVGWGGPNEDEHEVLVLTSVTRLDPRALMDVRRKVLEQERRAYDISADVYGRTSPAEVSGAP
jgi:hypothetical protein